jgi:hypothetical protein
MTTNLTTQSLALFLELANDAGNWGGSPLFQGDKAQCGNLSDLKRHGLIYTSEDDDGCVFVDFTDAGISFAKSCGIHLSLPV